MKLRVLFYLFCTDLFSLRPVNPIDKSLIVDTNGAGDAFVAGLLAGYVILI